MTMIGRLIGIVVEKQPPEILLDVNGVGYELFLPMTSFYQLPEVDHEVTLYTHLSIREDAHTLFGFISKSDRTLFKELIKTNGVGPKLALAILSSMSVEEFAYAIEHEESSKLVKIPGVGKKTADRLVVELKGKFKQHKTPFFIESTSLNVIDNKLANAINMDADSASNEAISALIALGYKAIDAEKMVQRVYQPELGCEQLIRAALKQSI